MEVLFWVTLWILPGVLGTALFNGYLRGEFTIIYDDEGVEYSMEFFKWVLALGGPCNLIGSVLSLCILGGFSNLFKHGLSFRVGPEPAERVAAAWKNRGF